MAGGCSGTSPTDSPGPPTRVGGKATQLIGLPRARLPHPRPAGVGRWRCVPPPPPGTQTVRTKENDAVTSRLVQRRESVPAPVHESAGPAGTAGLVGPDLGPRRRGCGDQYLRNPMTSPTPPPPFSTGRLMGTCQRTVVQPPPPPRTSGIPACWATVSSHHREMDKRHIPARRTPQNRDLGYGRPIFQAPRVSRFTETGD